jgi:hypothetical protein
MSRFVLLLVSLLFPWTLQAQYVSGTVVVLEAGGDYIAIAADSLRLGPSPGQVSHGYCKIVNLSDQLVFAAAGISGYPGARVPSDIWSVYEIAKQEYSELANGHTDDLVQKLAAVYGERVSGKINNGLKRDSSGSLWSYVSSQNEVGAAIFAGFDDQHRRVIVEVKVGIQVPGARVVGYSTKFIPGDETVDTEVIGDTRISQELTAGQTQRSRGWHSAMSLQSSVLDLKDRLLFGAERIGELTAKHDPDYVGLPIDVVLVTRGRGITWVHRKPICSFHKRTYAGRGQVVSPRR